MKVTVYGLVSSKDMIVRYIGQTVQPVNRRLSGHLHEARRRKGVGGKSRRVWNWIESVLKDKHSVEMLVLVEDAVLHETEKTVIREYRDKGVDLVNATDGGEGTIGFRLHIKRPWTSEMNRKRAGIKTGPLSEEHKQKVSAGNKGKKKPGLAERNRLQTGLPGRKQTDAERLKRSESLKGRVITPEWRAKLSVAATGRKLSAESIKKLRDGHRNYHQLKREARIASP